MTGSNGTYGWDYQQSVEYLVSEGFIPKTLAKNVPANGPVPGRRPEVIEVDTLGLAEFPRLERAR